MNRDILKTVLASAAVGLAYLFLREAFAVDDGYQIIGAAVVALGLGAILI